MLRAQALLALSQSSIVDKLSLLQKMLNNIVDKCSTNSEKLDTLPNHCFEHELAKIIDNQWIGDSSKYILPGAPNLPHLVPSKLVDKRGYAKVEQRASLLHALAHIEFNAINLALDIIWRFSNCPLSFYYDWLMVAKEEAIHFQLLNNRLKYFGYQYGDFTAHAGLWEMAIKTQNDILARLCLIPCTMEARGLDVTPNLIEKIKQTGDVATQVILEKILEDEIGHVKIGLKWLRYFAQEKNKNIIDCFHQFQKEFSAPKSKPPYNFPARIIAGFQTEELSELCPTI